MKNVIIIGSGPAGYTAAIYTARANLNPILIEGLQPGGQLTTTTEVDNFPGFSSGIQGPELMDEMKKQALRFGTEILSAEVTKADFSKSPFSVTVNEKDLYQTKTVIIATGASAKYLNLESEKRLMGYGVSACATCDGFFFKEKEVVVVGGGDTAIEEANFLTKFASKVTVIHRRNQLRASKILQENAFKNDKIYFCWDSVVEDILDPDQGKVTGIKLKNVKTDEVTEKNCDGVFLAIGHTPNTSIFKGQLKMDKMGYIISKDGAKTSIPGIFACGDVKDHVYRQAVTAAGSGCAAAIEAELFLQLF
ncbi:MAG: thioredoxin-disulfide reductase [Nitrospinota bacterium]|jgi:thioredoxin reductase (NADPH)|nr:thioredoxin-disulfide reductase [Nitrospinota bacterium]HJN01932.1 thioredoxin-disulfide reductase [Nitrospinota bacterium]|tara:strand:- start:246 stop:1166 length:921 start_codon:yes stop_codon:yes gene_type:complete